MFAFTTSTASATGDLTSAAAVQLPLAPGKDSSSACTCIPAQAVALFCTMSGAAATATLGVFLKNPGSEANQERIAMIGTATVAATAFRTTNAGGAAGNYIATTTFAETGNHKFDPLGHSRGVAGGTTTNNAPVQCWLAVLTLSAGSITIHEADTRSI